jgi:hypothetical protein
VNFLNLSDLKNASIVWPSRCAFPVGELGTRNGGVTLLGAILSFTELLIR